MAQSHNQFVMEKCDGCLSSLTKIINCLARDDHFHFKRHLVGYPIADAMEESSYIIIMAGVIPNLEGCL